MANHVRQKSRNKTYITAGLVILALLIIAALLLFKGCSKEVPVSETAAPSLVYDSTAIKGGWEEVDTEEIVASLNEKVEAGMINISMNTSPVFSDGSCEGNLMIVNEEVNNYPQIVEITRNDTGETIYKSGGIPVGSKIEKAKLNVDLPAGVYECTAMFHNVDPETGISLGCAGAIITITILE